MTRRRGFRFFVFELISLVRTIAHLCQTKPQSISRFGIPASWNWTKLPDQNLHFRAPKFQTTLAFVLIELLLLHSLMVLSTLLVLLLQVSPYSNQLAKWQSEFQSSQSSENSKSQPNFDVKRMSKEPRIEILNLNNFWSFASSKTKRCRLSWHLPKQRNNLQLSNEAKLCLDMSSPSFSYSHFQKSKHNTSNEWRDKTRVKNHLSFIVGWSWILEIVIFSNGALFPRIKFDNFYLIDEIAIKKENSENDGSWRRKRECLFCETN